MLERLALRDPRSVWHSVYRAVTPPALEPPSATVDDVICDPLRLFEADRRLWQTPALLPPLLMVRPGG